MKRTIVLLSAVLLASTLAGAGVTNPEGFEGYALTTTWTPTEIGEGWVNNEPAPGNYHEIIMGTLPENTTQVYRGDSTNRDNEPTPPGHHGQNIHSEWRQSTPDAAVPVTTTSCDWAWTGSWYGSEFRLMIQRFETAYYLNTWYIEIDERSWKHHIQLAATNGIDAEGQDIHAAPVDIPQDALEWEWYIEDVWYHIDVEEDNGPLGVGNGQSSRARLGLMGATEEEMGSWSPWVVHEGEDLSDPENDYTNPYDGGGIVRVTTNGQAEWDNFSMTPDPGPPAGNPGDANNDSVVSADDYGSVQLNFGDTGAVNIPGDANLDGVVSADDYGSVQLHFGAVYGAGGATVPEPATMLLLTIGGLGMLRRRSAQVLRRRRS